MHTLTINERDFLQSLRSLNGVRLLNLPPRFRNRANLIFASFAKGLVELGFGEKFGSFEPFDPPLTDRLLQLISDADDECVDRRDGSYLAIRLTDLGRTVASESMISPKLSDPELLVLKMLHSSKAFSLETRTPMSCLIKREYLDSRDTSAHRELRDAASSLARIMPPLVAAKEGSSGGFWITAEGKNALNLVARR